MTLPTRCTHGGAGTPSAARLSSASAEVVNSHREIRSVSTRLTYLGGLLGVGPRADTEVDVGLGQAELTEEVVGHARVIVLPVWISSTSARPSRWVVPHAGASDAAVPEGLATPPIVTCGSATRSSRWVLGASRRSKARVARPTGRRAKLVRRLREDEDEYADRSEKVTVDESFDRRRGGPSQVSRATQPSESGAIPAFRQIAPTG